MKRVSAIFNHFIASLLCFVLLASSFILILPADAQAANSVCVYPDLDFSFVNNQQKREYCATMTLYHIYSSENSNEIMQNLKAGLALVIFYEGASDHLSSNLDIRTGAVCVVIKWDSNTETPYIAFYSEKASTLPDKPLGYGTFEHKKGADLAPATVPDGLYSLYTQNHNGYAAFNIRTVSNGSSFPAVYMKKGGSYKVVKGNAFDVHTRYSSKISNSDSPWSAGCLLVGTDKQYTEYKKFLANTYPTNLVKLGKTKYGGREIPRYTSGTQKKSGLLIIDRFLYRDQMIDKLYKNKDAVDVITAFSCEAYKNRNCHIDINMVTPTTIKKGKSFALKGMISVSPIFSSYDDGKVITEVSIYVKNSIGRTVQSVTIYPNKSSIDIQSSKLNSEIRFGTLWRGKYKLYVYAAGNFGSCTREVSSFTIK